KPEKETRGEHGPDAITDEATRSKADLVKQQRLELKMQKDPNRPARDTSLKFGTPDIVDESGAKLVKGTASAKDAPPPPLEEPGKVVRRYQGPSHRGTPGFQHVIYDDGTD